MNRLKGPSGVGLSAEVLSGKWNVCIEGKPGLKMN